MPIIRSTIIKGPAMVTYRSQKFFAKDDIQMSMSLDTFNIESSAHGKLDERATARKVEVSFTPVGAMTTAFINVLWPYSNFRLGKSIFHPLDYPLAPNTGTDFELVIHTLAGTKITLKSAAITKMPDLNMSATKTMIGSLTFTGINLSGSNWNTADGLLEIATVAFADADLGTLNLAEIKTTGYSATWGAAAEWIGFDSSEGFNASFNASFKPIETDELGVVDMVFADLDATVSCMPLGISESQMFAAIGMGSMLRGSSLAALGTSLDLVVLGNGSGPSLTLTKAAIKQGGLAFGAATLRLSGASFVATRTFTGGVPNPLFAITP